jgi:hypothetical protein
MQRGLADISETLHDDEGVLMAKLEELLEVGDENDDENSYREVDEVGKKLA